MFNKINEDIKNAMKTKDTLKLETLRMMKSKILNVNARGDLPEIEIIKILSKYAKSLNEAIDEARKVGRGEDAAKQEQELKIVESYLPKQLSEEETKLAVEKVIAELGATSMKDMGNVMKEVGAKNPGIDNKIVSGIVRAKLST